MANRPRRSIPRIDYRRLHCIGMEDDTSEEEASDHEEENQDDAEEEASDHEVGNQDESEEEDVVEYPSEVECSI